MIPFWFSFSINTYLPQFHNIYLLIGLHKYHEWISIHHDLSFFIQQVQASFPYPTQIHFYDNFGAHNFTSPYCFNSQRPMSYWVVTISFVVLIVDYSFIIFSCTPSCIISIWIIGPLLLTSLGLWLQISLSSLFNSSTCYSFILFHNMLPSIYHWILILTNICYSWLMIRFRMSTWLLHLVVNFPSLLSSFFLTWLPITKFNSLFHWITYIRLSHLASCYSCYFPWFKMSFLRNLFTNLLLHKLLPFIPLHFVSNLFIDV